MRCLWSAHVPVRIRWCFNIVRLVVRFSGMYTKNSFETYTINSTSSMKAIWINSFEMWPCLDACLDIFLLMPLRRSGRHDWSRSGPTLDCYLLLSVHLKRLDRHRRRRDLDLDLELDLDLDHDHPADNSHRIATSTEMAVWAALRPC